MAVRFVLDTHALVWYLEGSTRLSSAAKSIMDDPASEMVLPAIALAEAVHIVDKGRTSILSSTDLLNDVVTEQRIRVQPLTLEIIQESLSAGVVKEMHDRLIVATALYEEKLGIRFRWSPKTLTSYPLGWFPQSGKNTSGKKQV